MALGKQTDRKGKMFVSWDEIPKSHGMFSTTSFRAC